MSPAAPAPEHPGTLTQRLVPLTLSQVQIDGGFWQDRQRVNAYVTIPAIHRHCQDTGRIEAWKLEWRPGVPNKPHVFWDSDVAKWLEAACYSLITHPRPECAKQVEEVVDLIAKAQQPDGYLNTHFTAVNPHLRWSNLRDEHELYCAGHLIEAGVAHFQVTGGGKLLQVVCRYADYLADVFGNGPGQKRGYCGHPEIELALVKLFHTTQKRRYLDLAKYFVDERGRQPHYFDLEAVARGENPAEYWAQTHAYTQSHVPVREQSLPVGHAVRGMYLYSAMADLAEAFEDLELLQACRRIFHHLLQRRMYVTGGLGSARANEGYTDDFDLPNATAYAETCAAIGLCLFAHRMLQCEEQGIYADVFERALYNGVLSGVALSGDRFFYENPLESRGAHHRWPWHHCSCCPPNLARLVASLGQYIYAQKEDTLFIHHYVASVAHTVLGGNAVSIRQRTEYPWRERITLHFEVGEETEFTLALRLPGWCPTPELKINGEMAPVLAAMHNGYVHLRRIWERQSEVELFLPMPIARVQAHPNVHANCGRIALQRGPLLYCLEEVDNGKNLNDLFLPSTSYLTTDFETETCGGLVTIAGMAKRRVLEDFAETLYRSEAPRLEEVPFKALPYFAWDNRNPGEMLVWMRGE
ncbi:MAG: glycoside hydrolase family 127 protein [bacterium]